MSAPPLPILGFRFWTRTPDGLLMAPLRRIVWPPHEKFKARCHGNESADKQTEERDRLVAMTDAQAAAEGVLVLKKAITSPGWMPAEKHPIPSPQEICGCGVYMALDVHTLALYLNQQGGNGVGVIGVVAGWGRVIEGEYIARSQYAKVAAIIKVHEAFTLSDDNLEAIAKLYDVPLLPDRTAIPESYRSDSAWGPSGLDALNKAYFELLDQVPPDEEKEART